MLSRAGLGDHAMLPHALDQQRLADAVVDLVCSRVEQVSTLQVDLCAAQLLCKPLGKEQRCWAARVRAQQKIETLLELRFAFGLLVFALQFFECGHQCFWDVTSAVDSEASDSCSGLLRQLELRC